MNLCWHANAGKLREIAALFESYDFRVTSAAEYNLPEPEI